MSPELSAFLTANGTVLVVVLGALAAVGIVQWRKARAAEQEFEFKKELLERGTPVEEIEKAAAAKVPTGPARRGLLEQFGALSGGAKAGIIFAVFIAVSMVGSTLHSYVFWSNVRQQNAAAQQVRENAPPVVPPAVEPADAITGHAFYLDLQPVANQKLTDVTGDNGHSLARVPQQRREFGGVPFQVGPKFVRLKGTNRPELPAGAVGVRVGFAFDRLHVLHGTEYGAFGDAKHRFHVADGTEIGRYRVRFADGDEHLVPVVYGRDVRDTWDWDKSRATARGKVVWTGTSPGASKEGVSLRLYLMTWTNPRPGAEVTHIDFVSAGDTAASPFCLALTAERAVR